MKKTARLGVSYDPIHSAFSLVVESGSILQVHSAETNTYIPDRTITPLVITPYFNAVDITGITPTGRVESQLVNIKWYKGSENPLNQIVSGQDGFVIQGYKLQVQKNVSYLSPLTIVFTASYYDPRTGNVIRLHDTKTLSTTSLTEKPVTLELDRPEASWVYDPIRDTGFRTINAALRLAGNEVEVEQTAYWWYKVVGGVESLIDPEEDLFYEDGQNTASLMIDPRYVDGSLHLRCKGEYIMPGDVAPLLPTSAAQKADTTIVRRYSAYDFEFFVNGGTQVSYNTEKIKSQIVVRQGNTIIDNPESFFLIEWLMKRMTIDAAWRTIGYGETMIVPKSDYINGADLAVDLHEFETLGAMAIDGEVITIDNEIITL